MNNLIVLDLNVQVVIVIECFVLCLLCVFDVGLIVYYMQDRRVVEGMCLILYFLLLGLMESYVCCVMQFECEEDVWVIDGLMNKLVEFLGVVLLIWLECDQFELGFWVGVGFWNIGFVIEVVVVLVVVNLYGLCILFVEVFQDNFGLVCVLMYCGFEYLGDVESWFVVCNLCVLIWIYLCKMG